MWYLTNTCFHAAVGLTAGGSSLSGSKEAGTTLWGPLFAFLYTQDKACRRMLEFPTCAGIKFSHSGSSLLLVFLTCSPVWLTFSVYIRYAPLSLPLLTYCQSVVFIQSTFLCVKLPSPPSPPLHPPSLQVLIGIWNVIRLISSLVLVNNLNADDRSQQQGIAEALNQHYFLYHTNVLRISNL